MDLQEALAREAIRDLTARYHLAGDGMDADGFAACFTEDGVLAAMGVRIEGRQAIHDWVARGKTFADEPPRPATTRHMLATHAIEIVAPDRAEGSAYFSVYSQIGLDHCGRYRDKYHKVGDRWLIAQREVRPSWTSPKRSPAEAAPENS